MPSVSLFLVGLPVQEIWDQTLDILEEDNRDLRSCALVSRSLTPQAQFHLFHDIVLSKADRYSYDDGAACRRLVSILVTSPHLKRHICRIRIPFHRDFLVNVCGMGLSRLRDIRFCDAPRNYFASPDDY
ncbi:hypothetical protein B0H17DRAFT_1214351 [Mycena rosella]|uniref:Uncharacterized protein n=1 Tax=Mycena rosella TaxID=1033263 RepID=A0AAD7CN77_MYCRO|nr:hypothetical protein B0H17DRAFT_1214351 [Mycena rosella]